MRVRPLLRSILNTNSPIFQRVVLGIHTRESMLVWSILLFANRAFLLRRSNRLRQSICCPLRFRNSMCLNTCPRRIWGVSLNTGTQIRQRLSIYLNFTDKELQTHGRNIPRIPIETQFSQTTTGARSEEHTSELQSRQYLVCR